MNIKEQIDNVSKGIFHLGVFTSHPKDANEGECYWNYKKSRTYLFDGESWIITADDPLNEKQRRKRIEKKLKLREIKKL